jgi:putative transposase
MTRRVQRSYKYRWYPTEEQAAELARTFGCVRLVYNKALEARTAAWQAEQRRISYAATSVLLTGWKRTDELAFLNDVSSVPLQQALRHLQAAFTAFWNRSAGYPKFKAKKRSRASAEYTRSAFRYRDGQLSLAKLEGPLAIVWSRPLPPRAEPSTVTVSRDAAGRWFVSLLVEDVIAPLPPAIHTDTGEVYVVGLDTGLTSLVALSTGEKLTNPRHERRDQQRLTKVQRGLARKQPGSRNRERARVKVARVYTRIADRRRDHLHQLTTRLVRENQAVVIEDLYVRGMIANHALARAISDAAWSELRRQLEYKCAWYGRTLVVVDRWLPSSKTCSACGRLAVAMPLAVRTWACQACGARHDRDVNAAKNILAAGLAATACGAGVSPQRGSSRMGRPVTKQEAQRATAGILRK